LKGGSDKGIERNPDTLYAAHGPNFTPPRAPDFDSRWQAPAASTDVQAHASRGGPRSLDVKTSPGPGKRSEPVMATLAGRAAYARRKQTVEPVFGIIKSVLGFRQFSLRGLRKVTGEWNLVYLTRHISSGGLVRTCNKGLKLCKR